MHLQVADADADIDTTKTPLGVLASSQVNVAPLLSVVTPSSSGSSLLKLNQAPVQNEPSVAFPTSPEYPPHPTLIATNASSAFSISSSLICASASSSSSTSSPGISSSSALLRQPPPHQDPQIESHNNVVESQATIRHITKNTTHQRNQLQHVIQTPQKQEEEAGILQGELVSTSSPSAESLSLPDWDRKRKREEEQDNLRQLRREDIGHVIVVGGLGKILNYKRGEPETLVVKSYTYPASFGNELRAYQKILASDIPIPVPRFFEQVVFPRSYGSLSLLKEFRDTYNPHTLGLALERLKGPLLGDTLHLLETPLRATLRQERRAHLANLHELGICHGDIKGNNIMFRTREPKDWVFIDFGEATFRSDFPERTWKRACGYDRADLAAIFDDAEAQYAIQVGTHFLESYTALPSDVVQADSYVPPDISSPILAVDFLRSHSSPNKAITLTPDEVQRQLTSVLELAAYLPKPAIALVYSILATFPSPTPLLAKYAINILARADGSKHARHALDQLDVQLSSPELPLPFQAHFHFKKITILSNHGSLDKRIAALGAAIPVLVECYGEKDSQTRSAKRELKKLLSRGTKDSSAG